MKRIEKFNPLTGKKEFILQPEDGLPGIRGAKWFSGKGKPTDIKDALPGDKYLDMDNGDVYTFD